ncbi:MAG TPA: FUSC family membrane protein [Burkholderiaceae bacterium]|jgi:uncharacterized membrane protein YccC
MFLNWRRLEAAHLNGIAVALGVSLVQLLVGGVFGNAAGVAAISGAVCVSLADTPNPPQRVFNRVLPAVVAVTLVTLLAGLSHGHFALMLPLVAITAFGSLMCLAWGLRASPLSFVGILALVFAMASHERATEVMAFEHAGWVLLGGSLYALWARVSAWALRRRFRDLALAAVMRASAQRLRSRAARIAGTVSVEQARIRASIADDITLAEVLQTARDQVFAARLSVVSRRQRVILLNLIELRDLLLASRLDIDLLGDDEAASAWRAALADTLVALADTLEQLARCVAERAPMPPAEPALWCERLRDRLAAVNAPADDPRRHLVAALQVRVGHMCDEVAHMIRTQAGELVDEPDEWTPEQLQQFLSPEGWPLEAVKSNLTLQSSVMRHALRAAGALSTAYALGHLLPWGSHAYWLVLSVAVVLRVNLEQTLARRNDRILGTIFGCLIVMGLAQLREPRIMGLVFIAAVGTAHAYVNRRYLVAATGATLMALTQQLMLAPGAPPPVIERLADTFVGAMLAWAFCFVLPSWEHKTLVRLSTQLRNNLAKHSANVLRWSPTREQQIAARQSRQQLYNVLGALAGMAQRTKVEPERVRLPDAEIEALLTHSYRYTALLSAIQQMLARRKDRLDPGEAQGALVPTLKACVQSLKAESLLPDVATDEPPDPDAGLWPEHLGQPDLTPWLLRRLRLVRREARLLNRAATQMSRE